MIHVSALACIGASVPGPAALGSEIDRTASALMGRIRVSRFHAANDLFRLSLSRSLTKAGEAIHCGWIASPAFCQAAGEGQTKQVFSA